MSTNLHVFSDAEQQVMAVERALHALRSGAPICLYHPTTYKTHILTAIEETSQLLYNRFQEFFPDGQLILSQQRAKHLLSEEITSPIAISIKKHSYADLLNYAAITGDCTQQYRLNWQAALELEEMALACIKLTELMPAVMTASVKDVHDEASLNDYTSGQDILAIPINWVQNYKSATVETLEQTLTAPLLLEHGGEGSIISFRSSVGGKEHYAILVGDPSKAKTPVIRIHSSCYTGDLLASLRCDCRDQLHDAIAYMGDKEYSEHGGIILYLMQEGRGIGLINKLRTYQLQSEGIADTVDANEILGFGDDERLFYPAAKMLKDMGFTKVKLLSNNPRKAKGLEQHDIEVTETIPLITTPHEHNEHYLSTKAARLGHKLPK